MSGKIFISCGQANPEERKVAEEVRVRLISKGFEAYAAIETQSIQDVNNEIISNLKVSDYYIFIDFRRDRISVRNFRKGNFRGSLFTNQELAIAYALGFDNAIFVRQHGVLLEGMNKYILSNAKEFTKLEEVLTIIKTEIGRRSWSPKFSRHLIAHSVRSFPRVPYQDHSLRAPQLRQITHVYVENRRKDIVAVNVIAHLGPTITDQNGNMSYINRDRCDLKWALQMGYARNIAPKDYVPFDAFGIDEANPTHVYLHSASDTLPRIPIIYNAGKYLLKYEIFSENFPITDVKLLLDLTGNTATTTVGLIG